MSLFPFAELFQPMTRDEIYETILVLADDVGLPLRSWAKFGIGRGILSLVAQLYADKDQVRVFAARSGFLELAAEIEEETGTRNRWLDALALSVYGVQRTEATFATTPITLSNATGAPIVVPEGWHFAKSDGTATYSLDAEVTVPAGSSASGSVTADTAGSVGSAAPGDIDVVVNTIAGLSCTNPGAAVGSDLQSAAELVQLCQAKLEALSPNGARGAYAYVALTSTGESGENLGVTRVGKVAPDGTGIVDIYLADADGPVSEPVRAIVAERIERLAVPDGINATVYAADAVNFGRTVTVYTGPGGPTEAEVVTRITEYLASVPIGGYDLGASGVVPLDDVRGAIHQRWSAVRKVEISGVDLPVPDTAVPVNTTVSGNVTLVPV